jgi:hypothetical protein
MGIPTGVGLAYVVMPWLAVKWDHSDYGGF